MPPFEPPSDELVVDFGISGRLPLPREIAEAEKDWEWKIPQIAAEEDAEAFVNFMQADDPGEDDDPNPDAPAGDPVGTGKADARKRPFRLRPKIAVQEKISRFQKRPFEMRDHVLAQLPGSNSRKTKCAVSLSDASLRHEA